MWVDEHVIASPDSVVSDVCHCAAQLIGLNDIFEGEEAETKQS